MERETFEKTIKEFFRIEGEPQNDKSETIIFKFDKRGYGNILINDVELFVDNWKYVQFETDNWGMTIRLYHKDTYIGAIVKNWEEIDDFKLRKGF